MSYREPAKKFLHWVENLLQEDGSIRGFPNDLACYYKAPTFFLTQGRGDLANKVLNHIRLNFMQSDGDFMSSKKLKSANPAFVEFWIYTNGWIASGAQRLGRFDISYPAWNYYKKYESRKDILSAAHLGLTSLYFGDLERAKQCGAFLQRMIDIQDPKSGKFYLMVDENGNLIKNMSSEQKIFEHVDQEQPNQAYFMVGYPLAFLVKLYEATKDEQYLKTAERYFNWILGCTGNIHSFLFAHKVGWAASCYAQITKDPQAIRLANTIANYLVSLQDSNGLFQPSEDLLSTIDYSFELAIWLTEIADNLQQTNIEKVLTSGI